MIGVWVTVGPVDTCKAAYVVVTSCCCIAGRVEDRLEVAGSTVALEAAVSAAEDILAVVVMTSTGRWESVSVQALALAEVSLTPVS
jgi:hypothetical protein